MIVKCINTNHYWTLRLHKEYEVLREANTQYIDKYTIIDEDGDEYSYPKQLFEVVSDTRASTLSVISDEELLEEIKRRMCN